MDPRLLQYYNLELQHLREMGAEFAREYPKIASRLGMSGLEVADPYVERLLEGVGFLAARVQLKIDAEFPRFTQALLEIIYPHYLAPTPSMLLAQIKPDLSDPNLAAGFLVPRDATLHSQPAGEFATVCEFRTAHDVTLWPVNIVAAQYFSLAPDLPLAALPIASRVKGGLRIRLKATAGLSFAKMPMDRLPFHITGRDDVANKLHELCLASALGVLVRPVHAAPGTHAWLPAGSVQPVGFGDDEALLPVTTKTFQGYRLLQEYFAFSPRFRFIELTSLSRVLRSMDVNEVELVIVFGQGDSGLERMVDASNLALFCTPAINLFPKRADRIHVADNEYEYHVVVDRTQPQNFEVHQITEVVGFGGDAETQQAFLPFYSAYSGDRAHQHGAYFTTRRERRAVSSTQKRRGSRSSYGGTEVFLSLVDANQAPFSASLRQLSIQAMCTNRDLVLLMPMGHAAPDLTLDVSGPVSDVRVVAGPSRPFAPFLDGPVAWRTISHLSLNYLSLVNVSPDQGAAALRDLLDLYAERMDAGEKKQIEGIRSVRVTPVVRRLPAPGPLAFGRGLEITLTIDETAFEGGSAFIFGSVLARYFARHVSLNSFTETVLRSDSRGEINRWGALWGVRPTL